MTFTLSASIVSRNRRLQFAVQIALGFRWGLFFLRRKPLTLLGVQHFKNKYKPGIRPMSQREITSVRRWQSPGRQAGKGWREHLRGGAKGCRGAARCDLCRARLPSALPMKYCVAPGLRRGGRLAQRSPLGSQSTRVSSYCLCDCHVSPGPGGEDEGVLTSHKA